MAEERLPIETGGNTFEQQVRSFLARSHDADGVPMLGVERTQTADKTLRAGRSFVVADYYEIASGATLTIEPGAVLAIV